MSHTIDPGTGWPAANGLLSATVMASTGAYADALATAFMVLGAEQTKAFFDPLPRLGSRCALDVRRWPGRLRCLELARLCGSIEPALIQAVASVMSSLRH